MARTDARRASCSSLGQIRIYAGCARSDAFVSDTERDLPWKVDEAACERAFDAPRGMIWLKLAPACNTWMIAVHEGFASSNGLRTKVDFARAVREDRIRLAASPCRARASSARPTVTAAERFGGINAGMVFETDGALAALDLVKMCDSKAARIVYEVAPVFRADFIVIKNHARADALNGAVLQHGVLIFDALVLASARVVLLYPRRAICFAFK